MWAVAIPLATELVFLVYLLGLWYYMEVFRAKGAVIVRDQHDHADANAPEDQDVAQSPGGRRAAI